MGCGGSKEKDQRKAEEEKRLTIERIIEGLKEGLQVASQWTVDELSADGGFFNNEALKIHAPGVMDKIFEKARNLPGLGDEVEGFEKKLNSAAEAATKEAVKIFSKAITEMNFADAGEILLGEKNAATQYLHATCYDEVMAAFTPVCKEKMEEVGVIKVHNKILKAYNSIPFVEEKEVGIEAHVTEKAMDGLFIKLEEYEAKIRCSPDSRTSELLKEVFDEQAIKDFQESLKEEEKAKEEEKKE